MLDCVLISRDEEFRRQVTDFVRRPDAHARLLLDLDSPADELPREAVGQILSAGPRLVFLDLGESTTGLRVLKALVQDAPDLAVIVAGPALAADALLEVMRSGASEYLPRPLDAEETLAAFRRLRRRLVPAAAEGSGSRGKVYTIFSAKGGTGVTTLSVNLAVLIQTRTSERTLLLDINPSMGTAALMLGLRPRYSYLDVIQNFHRIDEELLDSFLEQDDSGLWVLASPGIADTEPPTVDQVIGLLRLCQRHFAHVVVDAGSTLTSRVAAVARESDERLVVSTPELPTLRNLKRAMEAVDSLSLNGSGPPKVILNQYRDGTGVSTREVEDALSRNVFATLEWDGESVIQAVNLGQPAVDGRSRFAKDMSRLGERLVGDALKQTPTGILPRLMNSFRDKNSRK